jgi:hypothetical protein
MEKNLDCEAFKSVNTPSRLGDREKRNINCYRAAALVQCDGNVFAF